MTTEEIEKAGREYENKIVVKDAYAHIHYEEGVKFANKHWQEKTRWKSLETEPPELSTPFKERYLLVRHSGGDLFIKLLVSQISVSYWLTKGFVFWKEIE